MLRRFLLVTGLTIAPIHYYNHSSGAETGNVIIGGAVPDNSNYAAPYAGAYFYGDNGAGWVHALTLDVNNQETGRYDFDQLSCPSSFGIGPDNNLYVADLCDGKLYKYVFTP